MKQLLTPLNVAIILGLTPKQLMSKTMERRLKPGRVSNGHRVYTQAIVERVRRELAKERKQKEAR
jgi:DNA-binding transcriptional MerR regulator